MIVLVDVEDVVVVVDSVVVGVLEVVVDVEVVEVGGFFVVVLLTIEVEVDAVVVDVVVEGSTMNVMTVTSSRASTTALLISILADPASVVTIRS